MDSSFREQESETEQQPKRSFLNLRIPASIIQWLVGILRLTEEEQENAGIYLDRPGDE
jgi:hypothetical protein